MEQEQTTIPITEESQTTSTPSESYSPSIDYTEQLGRIEKTLTSIEQQLETEGSVSYLESNDVAFISGEVNLSDIFSVMLIQTILYGLIFGAIVFRHFRK